MSFSKTFHQRQTESESPMCSGLRTVSLAKALEPVGKKIRRNAFALILNLDHSLDRTALAENLYLATGSGKPDGIRQKIPEGLYQARAVAIHHKPILPIAE